MALHDVSDLHRSGRRSYRRGADLVNLDAIRRGQPEQVTAASRAYVETVRPALRS
jgi:hypothetical protein